MADDTTNPDQKAADAKAKAATDRVQDDAKARAKKDVDDAAKAQADAVAKQEYIESVSKPTPTPEEMRRVAAGEVVDLEPSGIPLDGKKSVADAISDHMAGDKGATYKTRDASAK